MKPLEIVGSTIHRDGTELVLYHRDGAYQIRVDGFELMTSRAHGSEEALAQLACAHLQRATSPRVLVGGLGMGFTLRAALDMLPEGAEVEVVEVFPAVVEWCRGPLAHLTDRALDDRRVRVVEADVAAVLARSETRYDSILLDVDNGPDALTLESNDRLYEGDGITRIVRALRPGGVVGVWSADRDPGFAARLGKAGLAVRCEKVQARAGKGPHHTIFVGRKQRSAAGHRRPHGSHGSVV